MGAAGRVAGSGAAQRPHVADPVAPGALDRAVHRAAAARARGQRRDRPARRLPARLLQRRARRLAPRPLVLDAVLARSARLSVLISGVDAGRFPRRLASVTVPHGTRTLRKEPEINRSRSDRPMLAMARRSAIADL